jgi:hypothetical protein
MYAERKSTCQDGLGGWSRLETGKAWLGVCARMALVEWRASAALCKSRHLPSSVRQSTYALYVKNVKMYLQKRDAKSHCWS